ncbi:Curli production assembly/transport component CsgG [Pseudomonas fluorescens]|uniref:CsgG/HfaB family protein n=1 Tax=Pseudomonas fluorescens TaxID=294 RepID=UPI00125538D7|nr:CsgG/HfaB family protein [Pseudomonas fluorescens]CAG8868758.1 Curli production assembly/transport component CsgG [Pseudomonas fluorescens]VVP68430.1 Curli production assembly/transport component CsgG [Pseudomonas fluorescens]
MRARKLSLVIIAALLASGCVTSRPAGTTSAASISPPTESTRDLARLPAPAGPISVAVYGLRDQTGQYKPSPDSSFSTSVTQGAASLLVTALRDSRWFKPVERENLQDVLTERKIIRALEQPQDQSQMQLPALRPANLLISGAIVAYESNVRTGGIGVRYLGIGPSELYRQDQVTINLRAVDIRSGDIIQSVTTTKTVFSTQVDFGIFKFVSLKHLLEVETGFSRNEPVQQCVREAIESALIHLIAQGARDGSWNLKNPEDLKQPLLQGYLQNYDEQTMTRPISVSDQGVLTNGDKNGAL